MTPRMYVRHLKHMESVNFQLRPWLLRAETLACTKHFGEGRPPASRHKL